MTRTLSPTDTGRESRQTTRTNLLKTTSFVQIPVKVSPHRTLNSKKGVIRCPDLKDCSDEEILEELSSQGITHLQRIHVTRNGNKIATGTFIVTFNRPVLPNAISVGYLKVKVQVYIPNPIRCFKCQRYGHFKSSCTHNEVCAKCGQTGHESEQCNNAPNCVNCSGKHAANAKDCPKWLEEKAIQKLKYEKNISYPEAKKLYMPVQPQPGVSTYASTVATTKAKPNLCLHSNIIYLARIIKKAKTNNGRNSIFCLVQKLNKKNLVQVKLNNKNLVQVKVEQQSQSQKVNTVAVAKIHSLKMTISKSGRTPKGENRYEALISHIR